MLTDNGGLTVVSNASQLAVVGECSAPDGAAVIASLSSKLVHFVDEQRDIQHQHIEDFASWFEQLVVTPAFVASIDRWT